MTKIFTAAVLVTLLLSNPFHSEGGLAIVRPQGGISQDQTGTVKGRVELRAAPQIIRRERSGRYQSGGLMPEMEGHADKMSEQRNVIVYLEGAGLDADRGGSSKAAMDQKNAAFVPHVLAIPKGTVVDFVNHDKTYHNVFSLSSAKRFNIGRRPTGEAVPVQFDKPGVVQVFCDIHSQMTAYVVVLGNPFFVQPADDGTFKIEHIPPGTYTIKVWHERLSAPEQKITVSAGGTATASFVLE